MAEGALWPALTRADKIFALVVALGAVGLVFHGRYAAEAGSALVIEAMGAKPATYALSSYGHLRLAGPLGETEVEIGPKGVRVVAAPCTHKICMRRGWMNRRGDLAVCVPNGLVLRIAGAAPVDAVVH